MPAFGVVGIGTIPLRTEMPTCPGPVLLIAIGVVIVAVVAIGGFLVYDQVLRGDSVAALTLPDGAQHRRLDRDSRHRPPSDPTAAASTGAAASVASGGSTATSPAPGRSPPSSVAGYRVREQLANLPAESDAVGRTDQVTGSITLDVERLDDDPDRRRR